MAMRRHGKVAVINSKRGMVAISTDDDAFTIIELLSDWDVEVGDELSWTDGYALGSEHYRNVTKGTTEEIYVQNHAVNVSQLRKQMLLG